MDYFLNALNLLKILLGEKGKHTYVGLSQS